MQRASGGLLKPTRRAYADELGVANRDVGRIEDERVRFERLGLPIARDELGDLVPGGSIEKERVRAIPHEDLALGRYLETAMRFMDSEVEGLVVEVVPALAHRARRRRDVDGVRQQTCDRLSRGARCASWCEVATGSP